MKPTSPPPHKASAGQAGSHGAGAHHYSPEEMHNVDVAHEHSDINISALIGSMVVMFAVVVGTAVLMAILFKFLESQAEARDPKLSPLALPAATMPKSTTESPFFGGAPEPKLMTSEPGRLQEVRTSEQQQLHSYGWIDEASGVGRIPIEEAKKKLLERGLPVRPEPVSDDSLGTHRPATGESSSGRTVTESVSARADREHARAGSGTGARRAQGWELTGWRERLAVRCWQLAKIQ